MAKIPTANRVVCIALCEPGGRVLLQKRRPGFPHGGLWEFPGGKVEPGESDESALVREVEEELGLSVAPSSLLHEGESAGVRDGEAPLVLILYSCCQWQGEPCCLDGEAVGWFTPDEAAALAVPPLDRPFIARLPAIMRRAA